jgi:hypothetical protein
VVVQKGKENQKERIRRFQDEKAELPNLDGRGHRRDSPHAACVW